MRSGAPRIIVYVEEGCRDCRQVRHFFRRRGVDVIEADVTDNPEAADALKEKIGHIQTPTVVSGDAVVTGWDRQGLRDLLAGARVGAEAGQHQET